ncbi:hypothetical protein BDN72DRAFT_753866 [Pluteus cervinus]|uniref:Uncharacterized protein n=1 Tax=Pluteus cervinus TaxID=181527 RepID=A0ACD3BFS0_9AGAR|nr:hypothetical protein BDN72DRAFT_753866 [Pluteus cervinus]
MDEDEIVDVLPVHFSTRLDPGVQLHQFPLLTRSLQAPPAAVASGKRITARIKPQVRRLEIHVPADPRPDVWNADRARQYGAAQVEDDREKLQDKEDTDSDPRLSEVRLKSEQIIQKGSYMLGIVRDGQLHLHPIRETHQFRPTLTYLDALSRKNRQSRGAESDSDSEDGPPPDPDEPNQPIAVKKEKKSNIETREVQVSAKRTDSSGLQVTQSGLSNARRELLQAIRQEEDERWDNLKYFGATSEESGATLEKLFSQNNEELVCKTDMSAYLKSIEGL